MGFDFRFFFNNLPSRLLPTSNITSQHGSKPFCPCEKSPAYLWQKRKLVSLFIIKHDGYTNKGFHSIYKHQHCKPKNGFFFGKFDSCVSFGCVVFGGSFQMVMLIGHCHVDEVLCVGSWHFTKGGVHAQWVLLCLMGSLEWFVAMWVFVSFWLPTKGVAWHHTFD